MSEKVDILVDPDRSPRYCEDYNDRKGCNHEIKLLRRTDGRTRAYSATPVWCYDDRRGEDVLVYVPHWFECPESYDFKMEQMRKQAEKDYEWRKNNPKRGRNNGPRRAEY